MQRIHIVTHRRIHAPPGLTHHGAIVVGIGESRTWLRINETYWDDHYRCLVYASSECISKQLETDQVVNACKRFCRHYVELGWVPGDYSESYGNHAIKPLDECIKNQFNNNERRVKIAREKS